MINLQPKHDVVTWMACGSGVRASVRSSQHLTCLVEALAASRVAWVALQAVLQMWDGLAHAAQILQPRARVERKHYGVVAEDGPLIPPAYHRHRPQGCTQRATTHSANTDARDQAWEVNVLHNAFLPDVDCFGQTPRFSEVHLQPPCALAMCRRTAPLIAQSTETNHDRDHTGSMHSNPSLRGPPPDTPHDKVKIGQWPHAHPKVDVRRAVRRVDADGLAVVVLDLVPPFLCLWDAVCVVVVELGVVGQRSHLRKRTGVSVLRRTHPTRAFG